LIIMLEPFPPDDDLPGDAPAPEALPPVAAPPPAPVLLTRGLGLRTRRGWAFRDVDAELATGGLLTVHGPGGRGRTMFLLAITGRARSTHGQLTVCGADAPAEIRRRTAVARAGGAVGLEPELTVAAHVRERRLLGGGTGPDFGEVASVVGLRAQGRDLVDDLPAVERLLLALALAASTGPALLVVDDVEAGLDATDRRRAAAALRALAGSGPAVVAAGTDPLTDADVLVHLGDPDAATQEI
jgi:ABC-type multidrug transport system ATPase subunit